MTVIEEEWGYACVLDDAVYIPCVSATPDWGLRQILTDLHRRTGMTRMIFSAVLNPDSFRLHLRNIVREWNQWFAEIGDYSYCIEIVYQESPKCTQ